MKAIHKQTQKEYEVTGQVNVVHIENEQEVLYTQSDIQKIFILLTEIQGELKLQGRINQDTLEQAQKTNGRVNKLEDDLSTIKLERAREKGLVGAYVSIISVVITAGVSIIIKIFTK